MARITAPVIAGRAAAQADRAVRGRAWTAWTARRRAARGIPVRNVAGVNAQAVAELAALPHAGPGAPAARCTRARSQRRVVGDPPGHRAARQDAGHRRPGGQRAGALARVGARLRHGRDRGAAARPRPEPDASWVGGAGPSWTTLLRARGLREPARAARAPETRGLIDAAAAGSHEADRVPGQRGPGRRWWTARRCWPRLRERRIAGAGLDVYWEEPPDPGGPAVRAGQRRGHAAPGRRHRRGLRGRRAPAWWRSSRRLCWGTRRQPELEGARSSFAHADRGPGVQAVLVRLDLQSPRGDPQLRDARRIRGHEADPDPQDRVPVDPGRPGHGPCHRGARRGPATGDAHAARGPEAQHHARVARRDAREHREPRLPRARHQRVGPALQPWELERAVGQRERVAPTGDVAAGRSAGAHGEVSHGTGAGVHHLAPQPLAAGQRQPDLGPRGADVHVFARRQVAVGPGLHVVLAGLHGQLEAAVDQCRHRGGHALPALLGRGGHPGASQGLLRLAVHHDARHDEPGEVEVRGEALAVRDLQLAGRERRPVRQVEIDAQLPGFVNQHLVAAVLAAHPRHPLGSAGGRAGLRPRARERHHGHHGPAGREAHARHRDPPRVTRPETRISREKNSTLVVWPSWTSASRDCMLVNVEPAARVISVTRVRPAGT